MSAPVDAAAVWENTTHPHWTQLGARLTGWADTLTDRGDVLVHVLPHDPAARRPAGVFNHKTAQITVDAVQTLPGRPDPNRIDLRDARDVARFPVLAGVLAHEVGHATHTVRRAGLTGSVAEWAALLEEPRMEGRIVADHIASRRWLQASVTHLLGRVDPNSAEEAARVLVLLGGRVLAGVLDIEDLPDLDVEAGKWLSREQIAVISEQTDRVVRAADGDIATVEAAATRIAALFDNNPDNEDQDVSGGEDGGCAGHTPADGPDLDSALGKALAVVAAQAVTELRAAAGVVDASPKAMAAQSAREQRTEQIRADHRAAHGREHETTLRRPTQDERRQTQALARELGAASMRGVEVARSRSTTPPGRLRTSQLVRRQGQIHARTVPTATPWESRRRRTIDNAKLTVGVALDISGSMDPYAAPTATAAWSLARAARDLGGRAATVTWNHAAALLPVKEGSGAVPVPRICGGSTGLPAALRTLERELHLVRPGAARLVAVVTDGELPNADEVRDEVERLVRAGVRVLWLSTGESTLSMTLPAGVEVVVLDRPDRVGRLIGSAAVAALRDA
ncbi:VWA domain containing CoxE-like protein [Rhodococcus sp. Br-6]|nr:VWA domain containing CoxE-like protein [Rhodococcus sp. Br-6]